MTGVAHGVRHERETLALPQKGAGTRQTPLGNVVGRRDSEQRQDVESQSPATSQASLNYAHVVPGTVGEGHLDWACNFNSPADSQAHRLEPRAEHRR